MKNSDLRPRRLVTRAATSTMGERSSRQLRTVRPAVTRTRACICSRVGSVVGTLQGEKRKRPKSSHKLHKPAVRISHASPLRLARGRLAWDWLAPPEAPWRSGFVRFALPCCSPCTVFGARKRRQRPGGASTKQRQLMKQGRVCAARTPLPAPPALPQPALYSVLCLPY